MQRFLLLLFIFLAIFTPDIVVAQPWIVSGDLETFGSEDLKEMKEKFPVIKDAKELESFLKILAQRFPFSALQATHSNQSWIISGELAQMVRDIEIDITTYSLSSYLQQFAQQFLGKIDSPKLRQNLIDTFSEKLAELGFLKSRFYLKTVEDGRDIFYNLTIDEGDPCSISKVSLEFEHPRRLRPKIKAGQLCNLKEIQGAIDEFEDSLREDGYNQLILNYHGPVYADDKLTAVIHIEGQLGKKIRYEIVDQSKRFIIDDLFTESEYSGLDPSIISPEAMTSELVKRYRSQGFADVEVAEPTVKESPETIVYVYQVNPGPQYKISNIQLEGITAFSREEVIEFMGLKGFFRDTTTLNIEQIYDGMDALKAAYQSAGYWDVVVREPRIARDKASAQAQLLVNVQERRQRIFSEMSFQGITFFSSDELQELGEFEKDKKISRQEIDDFKDNIQKKYVEHGFLYAKVEIIIESQQSRDQIFTTIIVVVEENTRVKIGHIQISGLVKTKAKVVTRELSFQSGDWYSPELINSSRRSLVNLGLFSAVQILPADRAYFSRQAESVDLKIEVREGKFGSVSFGPGFDIKRGFRFVAETSYNNLFGLGRQVSIRGGFSEEVHQDGIDNSTLVGRKIGAGFVEPFVFNLPIDGKISLGHSATADDFWKLSHSGELSLIHRLRYFLTGSQVSVFYGQTVTKEEGSPEQEINLISTGNIRIGRTGLRLAMDGRNDIAWPTDGWYLGSEFSWARYELGGNLKYFKWDVTNNYYFALLENLVFAIGGTVSSFHGVERLNDSSKNNVLPASERLYAGGSDLVRGFREQLGPYVRYPILDESDNITSFRKEVTGGTRRLVLKLELRYQLAENKAVSTFVDSGNAFFTEEESSKFNATFAQLNTSRPGERSLEDNMAYDFADILSNPQLLISQNYRSFGLAYNYLTPLGSLNIAYAWPWHEPKSNRCRADSSFCLDRAGQGPAFYQKGKFELSVGAKF
jgi:outer membrane protein insertion porin family